MSALTKPIFISLCYFLFSFGYIVSNGYYHVGELSILITTAGILTAYYFKQSTVEKLNIPKSEEVLVFLLTLIAVVNVAQVGARLGDSAQVNWMYFSAINRIFAFASLLLVASYFLKKAHKLLEKYRYFSILALAVLIRIFAIVSAPNPTIDVFYILRDGPKLLLEGRNPYELSYPAPYGVYIPQIIFVYGPLVPFIFLPSVVLFNDPRYMLILADIVSAVFIFKLAQKIRIPKITTQLIVTIFLFHPLFPFMTEQAWLEPTITALTIGSVYFLFTKSKSIAGPALLGFILAIKSVYLLPFLTLLFNLRSRFLKYLVLLAVPTLLAFPFLLADPKLFLERTQTYVTNPQDISKNLAPTEISLSIAAVILKYTGITLPSLFVGLAGLAVSAAVIAKKPKDFSTTLLSAFLVFFVLFMFGPFVYLHYYAFLGNILLLVLVTSFAKNTNGQD